MIKIFNAIIAAMIILSGTAVWSKDATEIIAGVPPGGLVDSVARTLEKYLQANMNQPFMTVNKPGAEGRIGINYFQKRPPGSQSLLLLSTGNFMTLVLSPEYGAKWFENYDVIAPIMRTPGVIAVANHTKISSLRDFVDRARSSDMNCGTSNPASHMAARYIKHHLNLDRLNLILYKGSGPLLLDLSGGHIDCALDTYGGAVNQTAAVGRVTIIATLGENSIAAWPQAEPVHRMIPGMIFYNWTGVALAKTEDTAFRTRVSDLLRRPRPDLTPLPDTELMRHSSSEFVAAQARRFQEWQAVLQ